LRILFIHEVNYLTKPIFEMHEFPEHLSARGHEVSFLHFPEGFGRAEAQELGEQKTITGRVVPGSKISLLTPKGLGGGLLDRLIAAFRGHGIARSAIVESSPDLIITLAVPTFGWQAVRVARKLGIPIVYRALDVSHLIRGGVWKPFVWLAERYVARNATLISANNPAMEEFVAALGQRQSGVEVHYPPMAIAKFQKGDRSKGRQLIGIEDSDFVVMYMGSFFEFSGLPEVIAEYSRIRPLDSKLLLVGGGKQDSRLRELVKNLNLETEVLFTGFVSFEDLPDYLSAADVLINPMKKSLVSDTALPNKVIQYLLAARPVVSTDLKGLTSTLRDFDNLQWTSSPEECIRKALTNKALSSETDSTDYSQRLEEIFGKNAIARFEHFLETALAK
jgi:glycosyltransferase involved in cell wall biosynthesis